MTETKPNRRNHSLVIVAKRLKSLTNNKNKVLAAIVILLVLIVGGYYIVRSFASSVSTSKEAEGGNTTGNAKANIDGTASGAAHVQFGSQSLTNRSRLGVDINALPKDSRTGARLISLSQAYSKIAEIGFGWVRTGPGVSDYTNVNPGNFDQEIAYAKANNLKILAVITYAYGSIGCSSGHCAPKDPASWAKYAGKLAAHWKATNPGVVTAVEVWNEANNPQFWNPVSPVKYTDLLKRTALEIKAVDPKMVIVSSGTAPGGGNKSADSTSDPTNPATFYKQMYAAGAKGYFDAAANHPYDTANLTTNIVDNTGIRNMAYIRQVLNSNGDSSKQIWSTESGTASCFNSSGGNPPMTEQQRANRFNSDLDNFWYATHNPSTGITTGRLSSGGDWKVGPYFVFKLYKAYQSSVNDGSGLGFGLIYNTKSFMKTYSISSSESLCKNSPSDFYEPAIIQAIKTLSAKAQ